MENNWKAEAITKLLEIFKLKNRDALPVKGKSIIKTIEFLDYVMEPNYSLPLICPTSESGIQLKWDSKNISIEIELPPNDPNKYFIEENGKEDEQTFNDIQEEKLKNIIDHFQSSQISS